MAKTKTSTSQPSKKLSREDKLKLLKRAKVYEGKTKIEKGKASGAQKRALAKFRDVIPLMANGTAKSVNVSKVAKDKRPTQFKGANKRIIVPVENKDTRPRINKKTGQVTATVTAGKYRYRQVFYDPTDDYTKLPKGKGISYQVQFANWGSDSTIFSGEGALEQMAAFMQPYAVRAKNPWKDWALYVSVLKRLPPSKGGKAAPNRGEVDGEDDGD